MNDTAEVTLLETILSIILCLIIGVAFGGAIAYNQIISGCENTGMIADSTVADYLA